LASVLEKDAADVHQRRRTGGNAPASRGKSRRRLSTLAAIEKNLVGERKAIASPLSQDPKAPLTLRAPRRTIPACPAQKATRRLLAEALVRK
jgi:hypothetical protein